jgi:hypothetical protein
MRCRAVDRTKVRTVDINAALNVFNNPSLRAYLDYTHFTIYRVVGEFEFGYDTRYDEIALALACVSVEMALDEDLYEIIPAESCELARGASAEQN